MSMMVRSTSSSTSLQSRSGNTAGDGRRDLYWLLRFVAPITALVIWELLDKVSAINEKIIPAPTDIISTAKAMFVSQGLLAQIGDSLELFAIGLGIGAGLGLLLGMAIGLWRIADYLLRPLISLFFPLPLIALFPLILILSGVNMRSYVITVAIGPFFTMAIGTWGGVSHIPKIYHEVGRAFRARPLQRLGLVVLPAASEGIFTGLRISVGAAYLGTIAVEFLTAQNGIGYVIWHSWQVLAVKVSMVGLVVATLTGFLLFVSVTLFERLLLPWRPAKGVSV